MMNGYGGYGGYGGGYGRGGYGGYGMFRPPVPSAPISDNPVGMFFGQFLNSLGNGIQQNKQNDVEARQKQAYYDFLEKQLGEKLNAPLPVATANLRNAQAQHPAQFHPQSNAAMGNLQLKQDQQTLGAVDKAINNHQNWITNQIKSNIMLQTLQPDDPKYAQALDALNDQFSQQNPTDAALIKHASDIQASIFKRNPSLAGINFNGNQPTSMPQAPPVPQTQEQPSTMAEPSQAPPPQIAPQAPVQSGPQMAGGQTPTSVKTPISTAPPQMPGAADIGAFLAKQQQPNPTQ